MSVQPYDRAFFEGQQNGSLLSAQHIVPLILDLLHPTSIIDVGCGTGTWLAVFKQHGIEDICGLDGGYVDKSLLKIPTHQFIQADLQHQLAVERHYDLVVSLEVAEHLPQEHAARFIESLTQFAPVVLFSAAVPFQGGTKHVNEQWQSYWAALFRECGFVAIDYIRKHIWDNSAIRFWYRQNMLLYANEQYVKQNPKLQQAYDETFVAQLDLIHPEMFTDAGMRRVLKLLPLAARRAINKRLPKRAQKTGIHTADQLGKLNL